MTELLSWREVPYFERTSLVGFLGQHAVISLFQDLEGNPKGPYGLVCRLPGVPKELTNVQTIADGKAVAETLIRTWAYQAGLLPATSLPPSYPFKLTT